VRQVDEDAASVQTLDELAPEGSDAPFLPAADAGQVLRVVGELAGAHPQPVEHVDAIERAYRDQGEGKLQLLPRQNFWWAGANAANRGPSLKLSAAVLEGVGVVGVPMYTAGFRPGAIELWIALFSAVTGELLAHLHGQTMSLWKTGATAAMAAPRQACGPRP